jgi:hypothetical protein
MRRTLLAGLVLAAAAVIVVFLGAAMDLELESVALLGAAMGAVVALVPDRTPRIRLVGFAGGFVSAWVGYLFRAQFMPDTTGGRAVVVGVVVLLCVGLAAATMDRIPLWTVLLGAGAFAGAYEFTYSEAPPQVLSTSVSTATTMAFTVAVGFLAAILVSVPVERIEENVGDREDTPDDREDAPADERNTRLGAMMEGQR